MPQRQSLLKPAPLNYIVDLPSKEAHQLLRRIKLLSEDPMPDGRQKKHVRYMNASDKLYRARYGRHRIIYTFDANSLRLLDIRLRDENTYKDDIDDVEDVGYGLDSDALALDLEETPSEASTFSNGMPAWEHWETPQEGRALPEPITVELLNRLQVPLKYHARLTLVQSDEALMSCPGVDDAILLKIYDHMFERAKTLGLPPLPPIDNEIDTTQAASMNDRNVFQLSPEQEKCAYWSASTSVPTLVRGGPGTGKSTVAFYRIKSLLEQWSSTEKDPRILFITYNKLLVETAKTALHALLGDGLKFVTIDTADRMAQKVLRKIGASKELIHDEAVDQLVRQAIAETKLTGNLAVQHIQRQIIETVGPEYLLKEFNSVIVARQMNTLKEYLVSLREGCVLRLNWMQRAGVWKVYERWCELLQTSGKETLPQRRARAAFLVRQSSLLQFYDAVIIDEAQDLDPTLLRMLIKLCKTPDGIFITADATQSMFRSGFTWSDVYEDVNFQGRVNLLHSNYRSTSEISLAAQSYLHSSLQPAEVDPIERHTGSLPQVYPVSDSQDQAQALCQYFQQTCAHSHLTIDDCAVLCPSGESGQSIADLLTVRGLEATYVEESEVALRRAGVKVLTFRSAKGQEFPIVALAGFIDTAYPFISSSASNAERSERLASERRTIYAAMTRAVQSLLVLVPQNPGTPLVQGFNSNYWRRGRNL